MREGLWRMWRLRDEEWLYKMEEGEEHEDLKYVSHTTCKFATVRAQE